MVDLAPAEQCLLQALNLASGNVDVKIPDSKLFPEPIQYLQVIGWMQGIYRVFFFAFAFKAQVRSVFITAFTQ